MKYFAWNAMGRKEILPQIKGPLQNRWGVIYGAAAPLLFKRKTYF